MESEILTVNEVADYLRMNPMSIYRMAKDGRIPASKVLDCWRFRRTEIDRWLTAKGTVQRFLLVDGDREFLNLSAACLKNAGIRYSVVFRSRDVLKSLEQEAYTMAIVGMNLDDTLGFNLIDQIGQAYPDLPLVLVASEKEREEIPKMHPGYVILEKFREPQEWNDFLRLVKQK